MLCVDLHFTKHFYLSLIFSAFFGPAISPPPRFCLVGETCIGNDGYVINSFLKFKIANESNIDPNQNQKNTYR